MVYNSSTCTFSCSFSELCVAFHAPEQWLQDRCICGPHGSHSNTGTYTSTRLTTAAASPSAGSRNHAATAAIGARSKAWIGLLTVFDELLMTLRENYVPKALVQALLKQLFGFVNVQLFNQLLLRPE
jgi:hypothetical protein